MQESPFIEHLIQKYSEQGSREMSTKNILSVLTERFPQSDVQPVEQALESIQDIDRLTELHLMAIDTPSVEAFLQDIERIETRSCFALSTLGSIAHDLSIFTKTYIGGNDARISLY